jgi:chitinase
MLLFAAWPLIIPTVLASLDFSYGLAVYWGQADANFPQSNLSFYCQSSVIDTINLAFIAQFGQKHLKKDNKDGFVLNLSSMCNEDNDQHMICPNVGEDIKACQKMGKKVVISLGGEDATSEKYGFANDAEAKNFANTLWNYFGGGSSDHRPFGDAVVDGFDFDIETTDQIGYLALAQELKNIIDQKGTKDYLFTASPQCILPDAHMSNLITNFEFDRIYVQFYNNAECELSSDGFNFVEWANILNEHKYNNTKLYIGLPAAEKAAGSGFVSDVKRISNTIKSLSPAASEKFGGLMFWDASHGFDLKDRDSSTKSYIWRAKSSLDSSKQESGSSGATVTEGSSSTYVTKTPSKNGGNNVSSPVSFVGLFISIAMMLLA